MTTSPSYEPRSARDLPWDSDREKRVLGGALRSWRRRERRTRALALAAAAITILLVSRLLPRPAVDTDETGSARAVPAAELESSAEHGRAVSLPDDSAKRAKNGPNGGFAGTGGHGGTGSTGIGGSAGTG